MATCTVPADIMTALLLRPTEGGIEKKGWREERIVQVLLVTRWFQSRLLTRLPVFQSAKKISLQPPSKPPELHLSGTSKALQHPPATTHHRAKASRGSAMGGFITSGVRLESADESEARVTG